MNIDMRYKSMSYKGKALAIFLDLLATAFVSFLAICLIPGRLESVIALVLLLIAIIPMWYLVRIRKGE